MIDGKVGWNTDEYTTAFLHSDWLYFLWHGVNIYIYIYIILYVNHQPEVSNHHRDLIFLMDFLIAEKGQQYLSSVGEDLDPSDNLKRARKTFCTVVTRINNASHTIGKDGKV